MAQTPEGWVKDEIKKVLGQYGIAYSMPVTMGFGKSGDPDIFVCLYGMFVTIEVKDDALRHRMGEKITRGKNKGKTVTTGGPTSLQKNRMGELRRSGGLTLVVDRHNLSSFARFIDDVHTVEKSGDFGWSKMDKVALLARSHDVYYDKMPEL